MSIIIDDDVLKKVAKVIGGEEAVQVVMILKELKEATDDQILQHLTEKAEVDIKLNDVRKTLFKLYNHSIVQCNGVRDENTGWFIFRWSLQPDQVEGFIKNQRNRILKILKTRLAYEKEHDFYHCYTPGCVRFSFEDAMENVFKCPVCGKLLRHFDNEKIISVLEGRINKLEKESSK